MPMSLFCMGIGYKSLTLKGSFRHYVIMSELKRISDETTAKLERGGIPLYYQLEQILRAKITSSEITPDEPFPTEQELCDQYGVSRAVVRQAFAALLNEGLIYRIPGKGTFLAPQKTNRRLRHSFSTIEELVALSTQFRNVIRYKGLVGPNSHTMALFDMKPGDRAYSLRGIRLLDDRPVCYFIIDLPGEFAPFFEGERLESGAILSVVEEKSGLLVEKVRQTISAERAGKPVSKYLELEEGEPVLVFERIYYAGDDRVIQVATSYFHPDRYHHVTEFAHEK